MSAAAREKEMMTHTVRSARLSDATAIARLTTQLGYEITENAAAQRLARLLPKADQHVFVAEVDGRPVGWLHVVVAEYLEAEAFGLISGLVVDRNYRRLGVGSALMAHAEAWARQQGCSIVRLMSSATREAAHRFYEHLGYTNIKTQLSFAKPLNPEAAARLRTFVPRVDSAN